MERVQIDHTDGFPCIFQLMDKDDSTWHVHIREITSGSQTFSSPPSPQVKRPIPSTHFTEVTCKVLTSGELIASIPVQDKPSSCALSQSLHSQPHSTRCRYRRSQPQKWCFLGDETSCTSATESLPDLRKVQRPSRPQRLLHISVRKSELCTSNREQPISQNLRCFSPQDAKARSP